MSLYIITKLNGDKFMKIKIKIPQQKQRVTWEFNPVTRVKPSKKCYSRKNYKVESWN
jgi:hypothetical protein